MIDRKILQLYCADKPGVTQEYPFDEVTLVLKVMGKMFALIPNEPYEGRDNAQPPSVSLKCDPILAEVLRNTYDAVQPGYHLSKRHWNTVIVDGSIPPDEIYEMIDQSYDLVVKGLKKADREQLEGQSQRKSTARPSSKKRGSA